MKTPPKMTKVARATRTLAASFVLLLAACSEAPPEAQVVADQFMRAYFVEDNMTGATRLASGVAKAGLEGLLREIEAAGVKEPAKSKPQVKVTLVKAQPVSADVVDYVYRVDSETPGIEPITAKLRLNRQGNTWSVSEFVQSL
jgi:hypothetical protein